MDKQIANQREMKNILNEDQYGKWRKMQRSRMSKMHKRKAEHSKKREHSEN